MFNFDLDYREVKEEVVRQPPLKVPESDGEVSSMFFRRYREEIVLSQRHAYRLHALKEVRLMDELFEQLPPHLKERRIMELLDHPLDPVLEEALMDAPRSPLAMSYDAISAYVSRCAHLRTRFMQKTGFGPMHCVVNDLGLLPDLQNLLGFDRLFLMQDASSQDTFSELLGNSILHGPQDQPIRVETLWRTNQALFGVTQKGHFDLRAVHTNQFDRDSRPTRSTGVYPLNYVNPHGRLRGNGFSNFANSPLTVGASYCPDADETTTFIHAKVPSVQ